MRVNNLRHKVVVPVTRVSQLSLMALATESFRTQVTGQLEGSVEAQERDRTPGTSTLLFQRVKIDPTTRL